MNDEELRKLPSQAIQYEARDWARADPCIPPHLQEVWRNVCLRAFMYACVFFARAGVCVGVLVHVEKHHRRNFSMRHVTGRGPAFARKYALC